MATSRNRKPRMKSSAMCNVRSIYGRRLYQYTNLSLSVDYLLGEEYAYACKEDYEYDTDDVMYQHFEQLTSYDEGKQ